MNPGGWTLIAIGVVLAFWTGHRWRHHTRTWADHKATRAAEKMLRKQRWVTLWAAAVATVATVAYLGATGKVDLGGAAKRVTPAGHASPSPSRKPHKTH